MPFVELRVITNRTEVDQAINDEKALPDLETTAATINTDCVTSAEPYRDSYPIAQVEARNGPPLCVDHTYAEVRKKLMAASGMERLTRLVQGIKRSL